MTDDFKKRLKSGLSHLLFDPGTYEHALEMKKAKAAYQSFDAEWTRQLILAEEAFELQQANNRLMKHLIALAQEEGITTTTREAILNLIALTDQEIRKTYAAGFVALKNTKVVGKIDIKKILKTGDIDVRKLELNLSNELQKAKELAELDLKKEREKNKENLRHLQQGAKFKKRYLTDDE